MKRRELFKLTAVAGLGQAAAAFGKGKTVSSNLQKEHQFLPGEICGMTFAQLRDDWRDRLFYKYLSYWDKGGCDKQYGGFMCELNDDGTVHDDIKDVWYQGRGIWVYAFLYNNFCKECTFLDIARKAKEFMIKYMYQGNGRWQQLVRRDGSAIAAGGQLKSQGSSEDILGALFAANGLGEYYKATGDKKSLEIAKTSIIEAVKKYERPDYLGTGKRLLTCSFMFVWTMNQLLGCYKDDEFEKISREHIDAIMNKFWNSEYGIMNSELNHDYSRIPECNTQMRPDHGIETLWMVLFEALRTKDINLFDKVKKRIRRIIEMNWDYVFEGLGCSFNLFGSDKVPAGTDYNIKNMWAHCEILIACLSILEYTGEVWAKEWYERTRAYILKTMATDSGIWRQAVDRFGKPKDRPNVSALRRCNYHQPRAIMYNLLTLDRMIKNKGMLTAFPA